jgi:hypothetical protein
MILTEAGTCDFSTMSAGYIRPLTQWMICSLLGVDTSAYNDVIVSCASVEAELLYADVPDLQAAGWWNSLESSYIKACGRQYVIGGSPSVVCTLHTPTRQSQVRSQ